MTFIERTLQTSINSVHKWAFSTLAPKPSVFIFVIDDSAVLPDPHLSFGRDEIPVVKVFKFFGLIFDSRLSFIPHLRNLRTKAQKAIGLIKVVAAKGLELIVLLKPHSIGHLFDPSWTTAPWFTAPLGHRISRCST